MPSTQGPETLPLLLCTASVGTSTVCIPESALVAGAGQVLCDHKVQQVHNPGGVRLGNVGLLEGVAFKIKQHHVIGQGWRVATAAMGHNPLPLPASDCVATRGFRPRRRLQRGHARPVPREVQILVGRLLLTQQCGHDANPVQTFRRRGPRQLSKGRQHVPEGPLEIRGLAGGNDSGPTRQARGSNTPLVQRALVAREAAGGVEELVVVAPLQMRAVVRGEHHKGVVIDSKLFQGIHEVADVIVEVGDHGGVVLLNIRPVLVRVLAISRYRGALLLLLLPAPGVRNGERKIKEKGVLGSRRRAHPVDPMRLGDVDRVIKHLRMCHAAFPRGIVVFV
mmetsp:Transcript_2831/g.6922  ORF Transcript_2831/g.6922 Transcript_2831/m.6922 type:complete len:336 (-) Transcript_2831:543-1550(-)